MLAFSRDGLHWSGLAPVATSTPAPGGRTEDHPVAGGVVIGAAGAGGQSVVHVYVQERVPDIARSPCLQRAATSREALACRGQAPARTSIVRHALDEAVLRRAMAEALRSW